MNLKFTNALRGVPQPTPPIWFMRQAGRYHKHYQALRKEHSFMELCKNARLAAEVALGPVAEFDFDVSILFSDLLFPLEALGLGLSYEPAPKLAVRLNSETVTKLNPLPQAIEGVAFQEEAMRETRRVLPADKSLIGFVGGPWTLFTYAVEGEHKGNLVAAKTQLPLYQRFLETLLPLLKANIDLQLKGGAELVMLFDTAAGEVSPWIFRQFLQPAISQLAAQFPGRLGYYAKGVTQDHLSGLQSSLSLAGFGCDHRFDLAERLKINAHGFVQGNFDQALLFTRGAEFRLRLDEYLRPLQELTPIQRRHWVCGLGHGVLPETPEENVRFFVQHIREVFA